MKLELLLAREIPVSQRDQPSVAWERLADSARFLDPGATSALKAAFFERVKSGKVDLHGYWQPLARAARIEPVILFSSVDEYSGAVQLLLTPALLNVEIVWEVVGEDLCIATGDNQDGLCLEESDYDSDGNYLPEGMYERTAWGSLCP